MKRFAVLLIIVPFLLTSCMGKKKNQNIIEMGLVNKDIERVTVTNNKYAGKYTIIDKKTIERFTNIILEATDVKKSLNIDSDFTFDFYDETKNIASFKYIAGIDEKDTANLIDSKGRLYHIDTSIEDEFINRLMKKNSYKHVREYYESLLSRIFEKINAKKGDVVIVDITKDYIVTRSITSIEQKKIIESIDKEGINIKTPKENEEYDYFIKIDTRKYNDTSCKTYITVTDKFKAKVTYVIEGNYTNSGWSYYIKFK